MIEQELRILPGRYVGEVNQSCTISRMRSRGAPEGVQTMTEHDQGWVVITPDGPPADSGGAPMRRGIQVEIPIQIGLATAVVSSVVLEAGRIVVNWDASCEMTNLPPGVEPGVLTGYMVQRYTARPDGGLDFRQDSYLASNRAGHASFQMVFTMAGVLMPSPAADENPPAAEDPQ